jgi:hypothetical protein
VDTIRSHAPVQAGHLEHKERSDYVHLWHAQLLACCQSDCSHSYIKLLWA